MCDVFIPTLRGRGREDQDQLLEAEELQAHDIRLDRDTQGVARQRVLKRITVLYTTLEVGSICVVLALVVTSSIPTLRGRGRGTSTTPRASQPTPRVSTLVQRRVSSAESTVEHNESEGVCTPDKDEDVGEGDGVIYPNPPGPGGEGRQGQVQERRGKRAA